MSLKKTTRQRWLEKLKTVYRFQIVDEKHYDVKLVVALNRLNVITLSGIIIAFFTFLNFLLIAYTPLKQYIPGYGTSDSRRDAIQTHIKSRQLEEKVSQQQQYLTNLQNILQDKVVVDAVPSTAKKQQTDPAVLSEKSPEESKFVQSLEKGLQHAGLLESIEDSRSSIFSNLELQKPVKGGIRTGFTEVNPSVTFAAATQEQVKAILSGNVILSGTSPESGAFIAVQADNQLVYILKNNSQVLKKTGNFVEMGEVIAIAGAQNNQAVTVLEVWYKGQAINPVKFLK